MGNKAQAFGSTGDKAQTFDSMGDKAQAFGSMGNKAQALGSMGNKAQVCLVWTALERWIPCNSQAVKRPCVVYLHGNSGSRVDALECLQVVILPIPPIRPRPPIGQAFHTAHTRRPRHAMRHSSRRPQADTPR